MNDYTYIPELPTECGPYETIDVNNNCEVRIFYNDYETTSEWLREVVCWRAL